MVTSMQKRSNVGVQPLQAPLPEGGEQYSAAEKDQHANEVVLRSVIDAIPDAVIVTDDKGRIIFLNPGVNRLFGYAPEELVGKPVEILVPHETRSQHVAHRTGFMGDPKLRIMGPQLNIRGVRANGTEFPAAVSLGFTGTAHKRFAIATVSDLTEFRQRESELNALNKELEAFSYSVSHDLRAPLRAIDGFAKILQEDHGKQLDQEGHDCTERIRKAAQRMAALIDDMLNLSRITRGDVTRTHVDLSALAKDAAEMLQARAPERKAEFEITPGVTANCDPRLLCIALDNLIGNAWKFTSKRAPAHIEFGQKQVNGSNAYFVRDNGVGFDMAYADKLFGAFQRLHDTREYPGTGIGLATLQRIIHKHGGHVWAEAEPEKGATFYFTL